MEVNHEKSLPDRHILRPYLATACRKTGGCPTADVSEGTREEYQECNKHDFFLGPC